MIIYFDKKTGDINGTQGGRVHSPEELKMWIGGEENDRIICEWKVNPKTNKFEPDHKQKDIFIELDKKHDNIFNYKVDVKTNSLKSL